MYLIAKGLRAERDDAVSRAINAEARIEKEAAEHASQIKNSNDYAKSAEGLVIVRNIEIEEWKRDYAIALQNGPDKNKMSLMEEAMEAARDEIPQSKEEAKTANIAAADSRLASIKLREEVAQWQTKGTNFQETLPLRQNIDNLEKILAESRSEAAAATQQAADVKSEMDVQRRLARDEYSRTREKRENEVAVEINGLRQGHQEALREYENNVATVRAMLVTEKLKSSDNLGMARSICEDIVEQMYPLNMDL